MEMETTADPGADTGSLDTAASSDSQADAVSTGGTSPQQDSAVAANPEGDGNAPSKSSSKTDTPPTSQSRQGKDAAQPPSPQDDWKRRHDAQIQANRRIAADLKQRDQALQELQTQFKQMQEQFRDVRPSDVQQFRQRQQAESQPIWHPQHPDHDKFQNTLNLQAYYTRLYQRAETPEEKAMIQKHFNADLSREDQALLQQYQDYGRQEHAKLLMNPQGYLHQQVLPMIQQELQRFQQQTVGGYEQTMAAKQELGQILQRYPELNKPEHLTRAMDLTSKGYPMRAALMEIRADILENQVGGAELAKRSAEEKERLLRSDASITRDPAVTTKIDLFVEAKKVAKERGIDNPFDPRHLNIQDELRKKYNLKG